MRTFKFADDKSYKFWNIELQGTSFTVIYGRIGTKGQTQTKDFDTPAKAQKAYDKLIAEKLGKGYAETTAKAAAPASTENVLEKALIADPDDLAAHSAYADWLSQQGDPRGEFIQVQLMLEDPSRAEKERKELQQREKDLLKRHRREWLGSLAQPLLDQEEWGKCDFQFARGWLDTLQIPNLSVARARALVNAPEVRLLRRLHIEQETYEDEGEYEPGPDIPAGSDSPGMDVLGAAENLGNLRVFHLGEAMEGDYSNCHTSGETAAGLVAKMPRLEELYLLAHRVDMDKLFALKNLKNLRILQVYHCYRYPLEVLARNAAFANLTHLLFFPHAMEYDDEDEGAYINLAGVRALLRSKHLNKITHLQLRLSDLGDEGCRDIVDCGILGRLKVLDLMHGRITDDGAYALAAAPELKNLDLLEISYNRLTSAGIKALRGTGVKVQAKDQYGADADDMEYLGQGDIE
jgi:uncharacterized protein (TIGR02996 family)